MPAENVRELTPREYHTTIGPHEPVLTVRPGETVITWCVDALGMDAQGQRIALDQLGGPPAARQELANPLTGPFYVEGAEPGDALAVRLEEVVPTRDWAWSRNRPAFGFFSTEELYGPTTFTPPVWPPAEEWEFRWDSLRPYGLPPKSGSSAGSWIASTGSAAFRCKRAA